MRKFGALLVFLFSSLGIYGQSNIGGNNNGGISSVSSLPATCTPGVTAPVQLSTPPYGIFYCSATNIWSGQPATGSVNPVAFGAKFDGKACFGNVDTIVVTSASNQVTCNHAAWTSTAVDGGKQFTASNGCCGVAQNYLGVALFPQVGMHICKATDSGSSGVGIVNATTANICKDSDGTAATASSSCSGAGCIIAWATNDDAAITSAETAWQTAGKCGSMNLPAGITAVLKGHFNNPGTSCLGMEPQADYTAEVDGEGIGATVIGLFSGFDFTSGSCPTFNAVPTCFGGYLESSFKDLQWNGFGLGNTAAAALTTLLGPGLGAQWSQFGCMAFGGSDANLIGFTFSGVGVRTWGGPIVDGCGKIGCKVSATIAKIYYGFCGDTLGANLQITSGGDLTDFGSDYGSSGGTIVFENNGRYHGIGSNLFACGPANTTAIYMANGTNNTTILDGSRWNCTTATSNGAFLNQTTNKLILSGGSTIGGTTAAINRSSGIVFTSPDTIFAAGAVTSLAPACTFTSGGGTSPSCALQAGSTNEKGVIIATTGTGAPGNVGTITLTFAGTYSGPNAQPPPCMPYIDNSGTAWGNEAVAQMNTQSTTAPVIAWSNDSTAVLTALATSSPYRIGYVCIAR